MVWGYSPFECEFAPAPRDALGGGPRGGEGYAEPTATVRVVECSYLRVIGKRPEPPRDTGTRYPAWARATVEACLTTEPSRRPTAAWLLADADATVADFAQFEVEGDGGPPV